MKMEIPNQLVCSRAEFPFRDEGTWAEKCEVEYALSGYEEMDCVEILKIDVIHKDQSINLPLHRLSTEFILDVEMHIISYALDEDLDN